jgi:RNA polymerase sigma factor (sigma-70 family)
MPLLQRESELDVLVSRCRNQDPRAWSELVDRFQNLVYSVARRYGLNEDDAGDVFTATFQALLQNLDRIQVAQTLPRWLAVTASREAMRMRRINSRYASTEDQGLTLDDILADEEQSAEENAIQAELGEELRKAVHSLQERCRELLKLLYLSDEMPYQEIAEKLGMPIGAIGPTRGRCLEKLRKNLESEGFFA